MNNKKLVHGFYLVLLGLFVAFLANRETSFHRRMAYRAAVMAPIVQQLSAQHYRSTVEIEKEYIYYPRPRLLGISQRANRTDSLQKVLVTWLDAHRQTDNDQYRQTALYQYDALAKDLSIPDLDPALRDQIQNGTTNTAQATLLGLTASALCTSLSGQPQQFMQQLSAYKTLDAIIPNLAPDQPAIAGQPFRADVFLVCYSTRHDSTSTPFVNGTPGAFERGQFHFSEIAKKRGQKQYLVRVEDKNPFTGDTVKAQKTREIRVW